MTRLFLAEDFREIMEKLSDIATGSDHSSETPAAEPSTDKSIDELLVNTVPEDQISMRKQIAQVIDPAAWSTREFHGKNQQKTLSLSKADEILKIVNINSALQTDQDYDELAENTASASTSSGDIATVANPMGHVNQQPNLFGYVEEIKVRKQHNRAKKRSRHK